MKSSVASLTKSITELKHQLDYKLGDNLSDKELEEKYICENSLYLFVERAWPIIEGGTDFLPGWHAQAICEHLEALYYLDINRLLINLPPRCGKSNICSVMYTAWVWTREPHLRFLYTSYAQTLSVRDSVKCRRLINSNWYQRLWGSSFQLMSDVNHKLRFDNNHTGYRIASSVGGSNTGEGGHFEICDDPNNVLDSESETIRESTNEWYDFVMSSRYSGTIDQFRRMVVQQRTHQNDVSGNIIAKNDSRWIHLCLPMEFEIDRRCITIPLRMSKEDTWEDPREMEGELLWPQGINDEDLYNLKTKDFRNDSYRIAGQLQQRPSPASGGIIKKDWFRHWTEKEFPDFEYILQSWDTALVGNTKGTDPAFSACTTWGIFKDNKEVRNIMLLSVYQGQVEYPELKKMALRLSKNYYDTELDNPMPPGYKMPVDMVLIEAKVSGFSLASELMRMNVPVMRFNPNSVRDTGSSGRSGGDKIARVRRVTDIMENGLVWLPTDPPSFKYLDKYSQTFIHEAVLFPNGKNKDIIDSMSQAFIRFKQTGWIYHSLDEQPKTEYDWKRLGEDYYAKQAFR